MSSPWLSLLVPVYRVEPWVEACIHSIRSQADPGVELLLLDDASPDRSAELAGQAISGWSQARLLHHPLNRGLSAARNTLLGAATGDYVWFLDSDDLLLPGAIDGLRRIVQSEALDLVLCDFAMLRERVRLKHRLRGELHRSSFAGPGRRLLQDRRLLLRGLLERGQLHSWSKIARRELWQRARFPEGRCFEDIAVLPALLSGARSYRYQPEPWIGYRQREGSILASDSPEKVRDLIAHTRLLQDSLQSLSECAGVRERAALDRFCLRSLVSAQRRLRGLGERGQPVQTELAEAFAQCFPHGGRAVIGAYLRRGWWLRAARAYRQLARLEALRADAGQGAQTEPRQGLHR